MITIIYQFQNNALGMANFFSFFCFLNNCKFGYTCFWLVTIDMFYICFYIQHSQRSVSHNHNHVE